MPSQSEIRAGITQKIVESLRQGRIPWRKPWTGIDGPRLPANFVTKRHYSGMNILLTWMAEQRHGWPVSYWATFNQFRSIGCHVRKAERATTIVFWNQIKKTIKDQSGKEREETFPILRTWPVFNIAQAEGDPIERLRRLPRPHQSFGDEDRTEFDEAVSATKAKIEYGYEQAAYQLPPADRIVMPDEDRFHSFPDFAGTLLHEIAHWTECRLKWTGSYAEGELRAEMSSAFLASSLGVPNPDDLKNVSAYIQSWLQALERDERYIFRASAAATKAADFVLSFSRPTDGAEIDAEVEEEAVSS